MNFYNIINALVFWFLYVILPILSILLVGKVLGKRVVIVIILMFVFAYSGILVYKLYIDSKENPYKDNICIFLLGWGGVFKRCECDGKLVDTTPKGINDVDHTIICEGKILSEECFEWVSEKVERGATRIIGENIIDCPEKLKILS